MKKTLSTLTVIAIALMIAMFSLSLNVRSVHAQSIGYSISKVEHTTAVLYNGYVTVNDTITLNTTGIPEIQLGFPYKYGQYVIRGIAYSGNEVFPVTLNAPLENRIGFYGANVSFPHGSPQIFSTVFLLANSLLTQGSNATQFTLDFPTLPSLTQTVAVCNASISLPQGAIFLNSSASYINSFTYSAVNLSALTYAPGNVSFSLAGSEIQKFSIESAERQVSVDQFGNINGVDKYSIVSMVASSSKLGSVEVEVPSNATGVSAQDQFNRPLTTPTLANNKTNTYTVTFIDSLATNLSLTFTVSYGLPAGIYEKAQSTVNGYDLNLTVFNNINGYAKTASATFSLPEGAKMNSLNNLHTSSNYTVSKNVFVQSVSITKKDVLPLDSMVVDINYDYNPLWVSFRPTLWMWALTTVGLAIFLVWQRPKAPGPVKSTRRITAQLSPDSIRSFVDAYEEKMKILREIESLEARAEKGRIPRRRYKVQRRTLETRYDTLSRNLADYTEHMKSGGGQYSDLTLSLEVAESEIREVSANIKSAETMHERGELSLEAYRKRLADYERRKQNAETTINGILLRLREEIL
jgi:hypothetical protein